jgi:hypothetical protein
MLGQGWEWQWGRVGRRLEDVRAVYAGTPGGTDDALDKVLSFFEAAFHLRDWLWNDSASGLTQAELFKMTDSSVFLPICGDLANGSKHLLLTSTRTGDLSTDIARNDVTVTPGIGSAHVFYIASAGKEYDALQVADGAVDEWKVYLTGRGLL